ncbi:hypothetical protein EPA93_20935 [Ktedonosporobacter rubrisoli]|uniref:Uncharacterized protein n=1 Tax=Ktedonosporobacter rubrisoli TaxID=2509675 RepID=A0A4P6JST6_KTERU|nr:hypothetical protein [Ktedonosporobacter rubrisoli]QBD78330.1 hypothetical protein EPA93_20935 [Ktedonosporobacter rubrisoli]
MQADEAKMTAQQHAQHIAQLIQAAQNECRADIRRVSDPRAQALFETVAEVLGGTIKALNDYRNGNEASRIAAQNHPHAGAKSPPTVSDLAVDVDAAEPPPHLSAEMPQQQEKPG